ncbi:hypothetical protein [Xanthomonas vesicatoria]|nr:hypothetical protein [Xanthomonas vesicatoria]MCC8595647.1 hypothetical protein [Xanthomonas vesicatoria]MCC8603711.1 hypothetical protein [Xanthomonas vesicatoria]MCC8619266.1 hypothetical protein [Xanthomonas vesicatoria]MCC8632900.1 hypothetical protein [Xanthomonas vesicatoria]
MQTLIARDACSHCSPSSNASAASVYFPLAGSLSACDLRLMLAGIQTIGMPADDGATQTLEAILGRSLRIYEHTVGMPVSTSSAYVG